MNPLLVKLTGTPRMREVRRSLRMTQRDVVELLRVITGIELNRSYYGHIEAGTKSTSNTALAAGISNVLKVSAAEIFAKVEDGKSAS